MLFSRNHQAILKDFDLIQNVDCYPLESTSYYPPVFADSPIKCALICAEDPFCVSFSYCYIDDGRDCNHRNELASNCQLFHRFCPAKDRKPNSVKYHYLKKGPQKTSILQAASLN